MMKRFLHICGYIFFLWPALASGQQPAKPNIIIILADDLGWGDVGFHGSKIQTPNIDRFSKEGVILNHYYTAPICSPTRAGLLTGRYPNRFGLRETVVPPWSGFGVDTAEEFIPAMLQQAGYTHRAVIGKWHLGHASQKFLPLSRGFTHFYGHYNGALDYFTHKREGELDWHNDNETSYDKGYTTDLISDEAVKCIKSYAGEAPFFIYVAYNAPHGPLQAKKEDLLLYGYDENKPSFGKKGPGADADGDEGEGKGNTKYQTYAAMVTCMDRGIGRILQTLKDMGIDENTLVIFQSDNGAAPNEGSSSGELRGFKFQEWEGGVRSPAIIRWPAAFKGGRTEEQLLGYVDLAPTLREAAGINTIAPRPYDGISMLPLLKKQESHVNRELYLGYGSLIVNQWKLVKANAGNPKMDLSENMLFNIMEDPTETKNVRDLHPDIYQDLMKKILVYDAIQPAVAVPPYGEGRKGFKAPKNWKITD